MEKDNNLSDGNKAGNIDSPINTGDMDNSKKNESLTNDEDAGTDPNAVPDKPSFSDNQDDAQDQGRFDGEIGI